MITNCSSDERGGTGVNPEGDQGLNVQPTLYIGLGGFGCAVLRRLKVRVKGIAPKGVSAFAFLGMDTQAHEVSDILTTNEYVALSLNVKPDTVAKMEPESLDWYRRIAKGWRAKNITSGANQVKAVGRLALRYPPTFQEFVSKMTKAKNQLGRARDAFAHGGMAKVYIISSLMGGTGAGSLLDVMSIVGSYFTAEAGPNFPYQAILLTPDVLLGEIPDSQLEVLKSNTYATLKELHHFFASDSDLVVNYDKKGFSGTKIASDMLPHVIHLIGDKNENGTVIASLIEELGDVVVSYLISEIQTPMQDRFANVKVQDQENVFYDDPGRDGMPRAFSSFGVVRTGFPKDVVEKLFAFRIAQATLEAELNPSLGIFDQVINWIDSHNLRERGVDQLQGQIRQEQKKISIDAKGNILQSGFKYEKLVGDCKAYKKKMVDALDNDKKKIISKKVSDISDEVIDEMQKAFETSLKQANLSDAVQFITVLEDSLKNHQSALKEEMSAAVGLLNKAEKEVDSSIGIIEQAIKGFFGRRRRVEDAVSDYDTRLESFLNKQVDVWIMDEADQVYVRLREKCNGIVKEWKHSIDMLKGHLASTQANINNLNNFLDQLSDIEKRGAENRFSLINSSRTRGLFKDIFEPELNAIIRRIRNIILESGRLKNIKQTFDEWYADLEKRITKNELEARLNPIDFLHIMDKFYPTENDKRLLFQSLESLSTPLFRIDENLKEADYNSFWIVGINEQLQSRFYNEYDKYLDAQMGRVYAGFDSQHEIILYQLRYGYTIHSYLPLREYFAHYEIKQGDYLRGIEQKAPKRPVQCWVEAAEWADLIPNREAEEALKWFILGRAFNHLFPTPGVASPTDRKNTSYLYARGSNYYLQTSEDKKPEDIGKGLTDAVANFSERSDLKQVLTNMIKSKIAEVGEQLVRDRLEQEYIPILKNEIEVATNNPRPGDSTRADILRKLLGALRLFSEEDLKSARV